MKKKGYVCTLETVFLAAEITALLEAGLLDVVSEAANKISI